jgi:16S rRNA (guanine966-N2)-methyltransferase
MQNRRFPGPFHAGPTPRGINFDTSAAGPLNDSNKSATQNSDGFKGQGSRRAAGRNMQPASARTGTGGNPERRRFHRVDTNNEVHPGRRPGSDANWKVIPLPPIISEMQITDGKHRGKYLVNSESPRTRLTPSRLREIMFRILLRRVRAHRFLDLCAGAGAVGIEAISRGALLATFVERSARMCSLVKKNLESCGIKEGHGEICEMEIIPFLKKMEKKRRCWDVVYFDPPFDTNYDEVLDYLNRGAALEKHGVLVIEHHAEMFFPEKNGVLSRWRVITHGEAALSFYERR